MTTKELQSQLEYVEYSRNVIHGYSRGVAKLFDLAVSYIYDAEQAFRQGQNAVWTRGVWEAPLLYACDTIPVSYTEVGRLGSHDAIIVAEDYYQVPQESCSMVKATLGEWYLRKDTGINRILGYCAACEPYNLAIELMKKDGFDTNYIDTVYLPPTYEPERYDELLEFFIDQMKEVTKWLTDQPLDEKRLEVEIKRRNQLMRKVRRIMELRHKHPLHIRSLPTMFMLMGSGHYFGKPAEYEEALDLLIEELEALGSEPTNQVVIPLVWAGGRGQEFGVYKAIDDAGGALLGWVIPTPFAKDYREDVPPLESLARFVLDGQMAGASKYRRRVIEDQVRKTSARGIILYGYVGCSFSGIDREMNREFFHKQGVPSISLEGSFQVGPPTGQIITRVKAFVEMLS